jgi:hypothetical protein
MRADPNDFANSPREYQHVRFLACLETAIIAAILGWVGHFGEPYTGGGLRSEN